MSRLKNYFFLGMVMGALMDVTAAGTSDSVYLLELECKWQDKNLAIGRASLYGTERPLRDRAVSMAGSKPPEIEVYRFSPFPIRFPFALGSGGAEPSELRLHLQPPLTTQKGMLKIILRLVTSQKAFQDWVIYGNGLSEAEAFQLKPQLSNANPTVLAFEINKTEVTYAAGAIALKNIALGSRSLAPGQYLEFEIPMEELTVNEERYEIKFKDFMLVWERRKDSLPLHWLKGGPTPAGNSMGMSVDTTVAAPVPDPKSKKSFWKFWK